MVYAYSMAMRHEDTTPNRRKQDVIHHPHCATDRYGPLSLSELCHRRRAQVETRPMHKRSTSCRNATLGVGERWTFSPPVPTISCGHFVTGTRCSGSSPLSTTGCRTLITTRCSYSLAYHCPPRARIVTGRIAQKRKKI